MTQVKHKMSSTWRSYSCC